MEMSYYTNDGFVVSVSQWLGTRRAFANSNIQFTNPLFDEVGVSQPNVQCDLVVVNL